MLDLRGFLRTLDHQETESYFLKENQRGEITVAVIRLIGLLVFYLNTSVNYFVLHAVSYEFHVRVSIVVLLWLLSAAGIWYLTAVRRWYHPLIMYVSTTLDAWLLGSILVIGGRNLSQVFVVYYLLIALAGIRYSFGASIFAGFMCVLSYCGFAVLNDLRALGRVDMLELVIRVLAMFILSLITGAVVTSSSSLLRRVVQEEVRSEHIKAALARMVSAQVAEELLKNDSMLKGQRRVVTVLMSDIRGFTPLSEKLPAEEVVALLNDYLSRMIDIVFKHNGTLDKFIGDAILAVFGAPLPDPRHAARAVRTAVEMQKALAEFNHERRKAGKEEINVGIGINSGEVVSGEIGSERRSDYTVIGDPVNLTQRLESSSRGGEILISQETYDEVRDLVEVEALPEMTVKGRRRPVKVYRLLRLKEG